MSPDFVKYLDNNEGELIELSLKYLQNHLKLAKMENNSTYIADCIIAHEIISKVGKDFFKDAKWIRIHSQGFFTNMPLAENDNGYFFKVEKNISYKKENVLGGK